MTLVLVHGNPETASVWAPLRAELGRQDVVALSPPGFGAPVPEGFGATADEYLAWLVGRLEGIDGPIDLVGHDWGAAHVARVAAARPDLIRSWCIDVAGSLDPDYVWHDLAQTWQTPGEGEAAIEAMIATPLADRVASFAELGMSSDAARDCAAAVGPEMGRCILTLYRSAPEPVLTQWANDLERAERRPALFVDATEDHFAGGPELLRRSAKRFGAEVVVLEGLGHWWMMQDPARAATALRPFLDAQGRS